MKSFVIALLIFGLLLTVIACNFFFINATADELEARLAKAKIIDESELDASVVSVGSLVKVFHHEKNAEITYQIVGSYGTDPLVGKISDVSPIGAALMGKRAGEKVEVELPRDKKYHIDILDVTRAKGDN